MKNIRSRGLTVGQLLKRLQNEVDDVIPEDWVFDWIDEGLLEIATYYGEPKSFIVIVTDKENHKEALSEFMDNLSDYKGVSVDWSTKGLKEGTKRVVAGPRSFIDLPDDFIKENEVVRVEHNIITRDYVINSNRQIMFVHPGGYQVNYQSLPWNVFREDVELSEYYFPTHSHPTEQSYEVKHKELSLPIHYLFHPALILWCKHKYWEREADASPGEVQLSENYWHKFHRKVRDTSVKLLKQKKYPDIISLPNWGGEVPTNWPF